jgi:hypothetical protein
LKQQTNDSGKRYTARDERRKDCHGARLRGRELCALSRHWLQVEMLLRTTVRGMGERNKSHPHTAQLDPMLSAATVANIPNRSCLPYAASRSGSQK